jgi:Tfp pilus assembly protein PilX
MKSKAMNLPIRTARSARQHGISLVTTLVMMLAVMVLGLSAILISKGEFVLSGNLQFQSASLNEAEAAVVAAEQWLASTTGSPQNYLNTGFTTYNSAAGYLYPIDYMKTNSVDPMTMTWDTTNSVQVGSITTQRYLIEYLAKDKTLIPTSLNTGGRSSSGCNKTDLFRIIARGSSARGATRFVQSIYSRLSC